MRKIKKRTILFNAFIIFIGGVMAYIFALHLFGEKKYTIGYMEESDLNKSKRSLIYFVNEERYRISCSYMKSKHIIEGKAYFFVKYAIFDPKVGAIGTGSKNSTIVRLYQKPPSDGWTKEEYLKIKHKYE
ncbi:hypothetical protein [Flammeovirga sp. SubArs3]|uniref:hypothetical protein n=1 Tax=Flammeovirga sp. SubArs3 TaxID=2995316 RepID=UPI00248C193B|nr:hypothetical protein [Flammeovirga sp. SubArs3]